MKRTGRCSKCKCTIERGKPVLYFSAPVKPNNMCNFCGLVYLHRLAEDLIEAGGKKLPEKQQKL